MRSCITLLVAKDEVKLFAVSFVIMSLETTVLLWKLKISCANLRLLIC